MVEHNLAKVGVASSSLVSRSKKKISDRGRMAEWSCSGLQLRVRRFDSDSGLQNQNCPGGEIGRHTRLKILRWQQRAGSSPAPGTKILEADNTSAFVVSGG